MTVAALTALLWSHAPPSAAAAQPPVQAGTSSSSLALSVSPAWKGWSRPGRTSELELRISAAAAASVTVDVIAGVQTLHSDLSLQGGRTTVLHLPVPASTQLAVAVAGAARGVVLQRQDVSLSLSESPLLGVALEHDEPVALPGFHSIALGPSDLPRHARALGSIDALVLDAATLKALDTEQRKALLEHVAGCGRVALVNPGAPLRAALAGAGGCGGRTLVLADSLADAREQLIASLAVSPPSALTPDTADALVPADPSVWHWVALLLALYAAGSVVVPLFSTRLPVVLGVPAVAAVAVVALLHALPPPSRLVIWSEGNAGARVARYQGWDRVLGTWRGRITVPIPGQIAASAQACDPAQPMQLDFDAQQGQPIAARFDSGLFRSAMLCFAGSRPLDRAVTTAFAPDGREIVRNAGSAAWPAGRLLQSGHVHPLPPLAAGASAVLPDGHRPFDASVRVARSRMSGGTAALWAFPSGGVADLPHDAVGWLLVSVPGP